MTERKGVILGVLNQCRRNCGVSASCFQLAASANASETDVYEEAMGLRADHTASELKGFAHVETVDTTSLVTGEPVQISVFEVRYEVPTGRESGQAFFAPAPRAALRN